MPAPAFPIQDNGPSPGLAYAREYVITYKYTHYFRHNRVFPALSTDAVQHSICRSTSLACGDKTAHQKFFITFCVTKNIIYFCQKLVTFTVS